MEVEGDMAYSAEYQLGTYDGDEEEEEEEGGVITTEEIQNHRFIRFHVDSSMRVARGFS